MEVIELLLCYFVLINFFGNKGCGPLLFIFFPYPYLITELSSIDFFCLCLIVLGLALLLKLTFDVKTDFFGIFFAIVTVLVLFTVS